MKRRPCPALILALATFGFAAQATTVSFDHNPFPVKINHIDRITVGGEDYFFNFDLAKDKFLFDAEAFGISGPLSFVNTATSYIPPEGANMFVLTAFDDDNNPLTPFGAGNAADLIANRLTTHGAGFFVYFNQSLDMPRLVYSEDLASPTARLRVLARLANLTGSVGRDSMASFTSANFGLVPAVSTVAEPPALLLATSAWGICAYASRQRRARPCSPKLV